MQCFGYWRFQLDYDGEGGGVEYAYNKWTDSKLLIPGAQQF